MPRLNKNDVMEFEPQIHDEILGVSVHTLEITARGRGDHLTILQRIARIEQQICEFRGKQDQIREQLERIEYLLLERAVEPELEALRCG